MLHLINLVLNYFLLKLKTNNNNYHYNNNNNNSNNNKNNNNNNNKINKIMIIKIILIIMHKNCKIYNNLNSRNLSLVHFLHYNKKEKIQLKRIII